MSRALATLKAGLLTSSVERWLEETRGGSGESSISFTEAGFDS